MGTKIIQTNDGYSHYIMAADEDFGEGYPPLLRTLGGLFGARALIYSFFICFLFVFLFPLMIYVYTKEVFSVWFYFSISSFVYIVLGGLFAEGLVLMFFLSLFMIKNIWARLLLVILGTLAHSTGAYLLPATFILLELEDKAVYFFGITLPQIFHENLNGYPYWYTAFTLNSIMALLVKIAPIPFLAVAVKELWERKEFALLLMIPIAFVSAWFVGIRTFHIIGLITILGFSLGFHKLKHKFVWLALSVITFAYIFFSWGIFYI